MDNLGLIPIIMMHNIPLPGLEEQIISIHKEASIAALKYSVEQANHHIILGLDYEIKCANENKQDLDGELNENIKAGVLCKIIKEFEEIKDGKQQIKMLLITHSRIILSKIRKLQYNHQIISIAPIEENEADNLDYIENNIVKLTQFHLHKKHAEINKTEDTNKINLEIVSLMEKFKSYCHVYSSMQIYSFINEIENNSKKIDKLAYEFQLTQEEIFQLATEFRILQRIKVVSAIIDKAILRHQLGKTIDEQVKEQIEKTQKIYLLTEKLKVINKELDNLTGEISDSDALEEKLNGLSINEDIKFKLRSEIRRLKTMHNNSSDASVIRNYLDWCLNMPWAIFSEIKKDFSSVYNDLNREHYGMEKVKERILEYLTIDFRKGTRTKSALLLVGPPGVGKTSISRKIANALGREFARISLGGIRDEADIRGHRRTYLGSMPGKIMRAIRDTKSMNPVILLDEIDKIGNDFRGDPAAALLEVLDKEQNKDFLDHYLDIPFDLSSVLFICTANSLSGISRPLLDRVEIITLASYSDDEKLNIATNYMIPRQMKEHNIESSEIEFSTDAVKTIINRYTHEAGVRNLEEQTSIILRKSLLKIINENASIPIKINENNLKDFLGLPKYIREQDQKPMIGIINGLAWSELGGDVLTIECVSIPNETPNYTGSIKYTGKLGEVMQESIQTAFSHLKSCRKEIGIKESDYTTLDIHVHVPEGGTPKDGPSAGVTIFTALSSLLLKKMIKTDIAMTGEITLRGRVLAIGGLKEKILAAKRNNIKTIIIPRENERELNEIPEDLKKDLEIIMIAEAVEALPFAIIDYKKNLKKSKKI